MKIIILTVNKKGYDLYKKLKLMTDYDIIIKNFPLTCENYGIETSDTSDCVKRSIWDNTLQCIKEGLEYDNQVCVLQDDFIPYENFHENLSRSENFINTNDTDMLFLSSHPTTKFTKTDNKYIAKVEGNCNGWQSVIFTNSFLDKVNQFPINIPDGIHSDTYLNNYFNKDINSYIHIPSSGMQDKSSYWRRRFEYGLLYNFRYNYKYGDPIWLIFILIIILIIIILYIIK